MPQTAKIATCSYCGSRAALKLDKYRHELACRSCGAPLHDMKFMPLAKSAAARDPEKPAFRPARMDFNYEKSKGYKPKRKSKRKRKPVMRRVFEEIWDVVEDIFD